MKDLCLRCGRCCLLRERFGQVEVATDKHCPQFYLDNGLGTCKIYGKHTGTRIGNDGICLSIEQMIEARVAPEDCPYAKRVKGYRTIVINF